MERNYVTINGVNSLTISGLYIKDLPPIIKPLMRYTKEEIDGRDGDLITRLGYSSYDKEFTIGLAGDYDIDEVISFFNPTPTTDVLNVIPPYCTFVFSNEPDKVYWGEILEQIDYNALLKFKTATVKVHCQPFKYKIEDDSVSGTDTLTFTNEGNIYSKPIITLTGYGEVELTLNGTQYFSIDLGGSSSDIKVLTLYIAQSEATIKDFQEQTTEYANRQVTGDYNSFKVPVGQNTITFTSIDGDVTSSSIQLRSRWI